MYSPRTVEHLSLVQVETKKVFTVSNEDTYGVQGQKLVFLQNLKVWEQGWTSLFRRASRFMW